jgi:hypothetical protein
MGPYAPVAQGHSGLRPALSGHRRIPGFAKPPRHATLKRGPVWVRDSSSPFIEYSLSARECGHSYQCRDKESVSAVSDSPPFRRERAPGRGNPPLDATSSNAGEVSRIDKLAKVDMPWVVVGAAPRHLLSGHG